jgi:hypothetical protein
LFWSAAIPEQGGDGHVNCQPKEYWEQKFIQRGLQRNQVIEFDFLSFMKNGYHMGWLVQNIMVFQNG